MNFVNRQRELVQVDDFVDRQRAGKTSLLSKWLDQRRPREKPSSGQQPRREANFSRETFRRRC